MRERRNSSNKRSCEPCMMSKYYFLVVDKITTLQILLEEFVVCQATVVAEFAIIEGKFLD